MSLRYMLLNQLKSLQESGYDVYGISAPGPERPVIEAAGIHYLPVKMTRNFTPLADLAALWQLYRVLKRERFTIVHTHTPKPGLLGQLAARMAGVPIVINTIHGFYFHEHMQPIWRRFYITLEKIAARCSDVVLSQNHEDVDTAIQEGICQPERIKYLGNGFNLEQFDRACLDDSHLESKRRELSLPPDVPVVGFVGRLVAEKGILELLQAARLIVQQIPQAAVGGQRRQHATFQRRQTCTRFVQLFRIAQPDPRVVLDRRCLGHPRLQLRIQIAPQQSVGQLPDGGRNHQRPQIRTVARLIRANQKRHRSHPCG